MLLNKQHINDKIQWVLEYCTTYNNIKPYWNLQKKHFYIS
jgi:hypothetical protein